MSGAARFQLLVKAGKDGKCVGDCPFSQRANMFAHMKLPDNSQLEITPVDTTNKPEYFLKLNPEGKVPVLIDREKNTVIPDSTDITKYFETLFPEKGNQQGDPASQTDALEASSDIFPKFAQFLKNKDDAKENELRKALVDELQKLDSFLQKKSGDGEYLMCSSLSDVDCQVLPKLRHVQVAGRHYKQFIIPEELSALGAYIKCGEASDIFKSTCPHDEDIIWGWSKHFT